MGTTPASYDLQPPGPLEAFTGTIHRNRIGPLYSAGLAVVALAMVLLPLIYISLIGCTVWLVFLHLRNDTWLFEHGSGGFYRLVIGYLGPAVAGGILVFFMLKPFFAAKVKPAEPLKLDPSQEPLLFAFVSKICGLVGSTAPCRIDIDCQVNASASLRRGLGSHDLVLTIGLPLAAGLNMRQFAGVLAHEFGHFAQGAGMRLTYIIRKINFWFARVVYERDEWDVKLERSVRGVDFRFAIILQVARGCIWLTRQILKVLMQAGHAISCFMLRQMEYDADRYEAKVAGSDAFAETAALLRQLNVASQFAYEDVQESWQSQRLPEDLPRLIGHKAGALPAELRNQLAASAESGKTGWFDTHPCDADRVRAARRWNEPGVFRATEPAHGLFSDFAALSKAVTRHQYETNFQIKFTAENLISSEEILRESAARSEADILIMNFYGGVSISLLPLLKTAAAMAPDAEANVTERWQNAYQKSQELREEAVQLSKECDELEKRRIDLTAVHCLATAGFKLEPDQFGLASHLTSVSEQEEAARQGLDAIASSMSERLTKLEPFMESLRERVTLALGLFRKHKGHALAGEMSEHATLCAAVGGEMRRTRQLGVKLKAFSLLAQNRGNHSNAEQVDHVVAELAEELRTGVQEIQDHLGSFRYPFPHARGALTVGEYARHEKPEEHCWLAAYQEADTHVQRLFALNYRLIGRLLAYADEGEKRREPDKFALPPGG